MSREKWVRMRRLTGILAVIALLVAAALLPMSSVLADGPRPGGGVPLDWVSEDNHAAENAASIKIKEDRLAAMRSGPSALLDFPLFLRLDSVPGIAQECENWCGPAATQEILRYKGDSSSTQATIAGWESSCACNDACGTALVPIRDALNQHTPGLPFSYFYATRHLDNSSLSAAAYDLQSFEHVDLSTYAMPFVVLLDTRPSDTYHLQGWGVSAIHYITINGYEGQYDGSDGSATTYYRDTAVNHQPTEQHFVYLNHMAECIRSNNGAYGGDSDRDIVW